MEGHNKIELNELNFFFAVFEVLQHTGYLYLLSINVLSTFAHLTMLLVCHSASREPIHPIYRFDSLHWLFSSLDKYSLRVA